MTRNSQYTPPADYAIPNPLGPRIHNWRGGPLNEGSLYHGPNYTRPDYRMPWMMRPLQGTGQVGFPEEFVRDFSIATFSMAMEFAYPELADRLDAELLRRIEKFGEEEAKDRLYRCIVENFPKDEQPDISLPPIEGEPTPDQVNILRQIFPRNKSEAAVGCFEGPKMGNAAILLPLVAGGALILWLATRR